MVGFYLYNVFHPTWGWLVTQWDFEPSVIAGLVILSLAYLYACGFRVRVAGGPRAIPGRKCTTAQLRWFAASILVLILALLSPLDYVGDNYLFSAHMIQHLVLASVWPPLFLMSLPEAVVAPTLRLPPVEKPALWLTYPAVAFLIFNVDIAIWHLPAWYDLTLRNEGVHILEHLTFMATGVLAWWPILSPVRSRRLSFANQELYLFASLMPMMALGILFTFYQHPLYSPYVAAPRLWGISALTDQQVGGLVMWMPGNIPYVLAMLAIMVVWFDRGDPLEQYRVSTRVPALPDYAAGLAPTHFDAGGLEGSERAG